MTGEESFEPRIYRLEDAIEFYKKVFEQDGELPTSVERCVTELTNHFKEIPPDALAARAGISPYLGSITVNNLESTLEKVYASGGKMFMDNTENIEKIGGLQCFVCDPYGNLFSLFEPHNHSPQS